MPPLDEVDEVEVPGLPSYDVDERLQSLGDDCVGMNLLADHQTHPNQQTPSLRTLKSTRVQSISVLYRVECPMGEVWLTPTPTQGTCLV